MVDMDMTDEQLHGAIAATASEARRVTALRDDLIRQARSRGWSLRRIAAAAGLSHGGVARVVERVS